MLWYSLVELDLLFTLIALVVYGLFSLREGRLNLSDVYFFCTLYPLLFVCGMHVESGAANYTPNLDLLLALLSSVIMLSFRSFESVFLLVLGFISNYFLQHSIDFLTFIICLEAQNFVFIVLCGLHTSKTSDSFSVEATLKYFVLSAFSTGVLLYWFSNVYISTGLLTFSDLNVLYGSNSLFGYQVLTAMMFKLGAAPLHLWVTGVYAGVKRNLLMYIGTAPKLALFGFWVNTFHQSISGFSVLLFAAFSIALGSLGAYNQPALRNLFAYSTVNEIGIMLLAVETAGFHSLFQHLGLYIVAQLLLWNLDDKRMFSVVAVTLAGLPPLAGFFGKSWVFWHVASTGQFPVLVLALVCTGISLVYYLRVIRLFWNRNNATTLRVVSFGDHYRSTINKASTMYSLDSRVMLTSLCAVLLVLLPLFVIKPFVL